MEKPQKKDRRKKVLISFRVVNAPGVETFSGALQYLKGFAKWKISMFSLPVMISKEAITAAENEKVEGILINHPLGDDLSDVLRGSEIPLVVLGNTDDRLFKRRRNIIFIEADNREVGRKAALYFSGLGRFRSYGFLPDIPATRWSRMRLRGFRCELAKRGQRVNVFTTDAPEGSGNYREALKNWFRSLPLPAAVLLVGDYRVVSALEACADAGLSVPNDVAFLGVDNNPMYCDATTPSLSSIEPAFRQEGFEGAKALDQLMRLKKPLSRPKIIRIAPLRIIERDSTAPTAPGPHLVDRALAFISENAESPITAKNVAERLGVSSSLLALRFRQYEKTSVRDAIIRMRLEKVAKLLSGSDATVKNIAQRLGFSSAAHLTHLFTDKYGKSPRAWRRSQAK